MRSKLIYLGMLLLLSKQGLATTYVLPEHGNVIGKSVYRYPEFGETLIDVGIRFDMGYNEMRVANPNIDPTILLKPTTKVLIPSHFTLPNVPRRGIVINLTDYRLYYFPENDNVVFTFPVGIGRKDWNTPTGKTTIVDKARSPVWHPSSKLRDEANQNGIQFPDEFPANEANPLGQYVLHLGWPTYLIHASNHPGGVGMRVSAGCIRLLTDDMESLFNRVTVGTSVLVIDGRADKH